MLNSLMGSLTWPGYSGGGGPSGAGLPAASRATMAPPSRVPRSHSTRRATCVWAGACQGLRE